MSYFHIAFHLLNHKEFVLQGFDQFACLRVYEVKIHFEDFGC